MKALAVASGIVFWTLVLGAIILIFFPSGDEGEPVAVLDIETVPSTAAPVTTDGVDLPPGFAVAPVARASALPGQGTTMMPTTPGPGTTMTPPPPPPPPGP
ncbi:MAG: hypothetical protein KAX78_12170, partial [Phycisphaerae bacterium]|nr:hypothetical protein [Phycisphaerae bacterium]